MVDGQVHHQALLAAVFGDEAHPGRHRRRGRPGRNCGAVDQHLAGVPIVDAEDRPRHFAAAGTHQT